MSVTCGGDGSVIHLPTEGGDFVARGRQIGLVTLATDQGIEAELRRLVPPGASVYTSRSTSYVGLGPEAAFAAIREAVARLVPGLALDAVGFACSSGSFLLDEEPLVEALRSGRGRPRTATVKRAVIEAAAERGIRSVSLLTPYDADLTGLITFQLGLAGLRVVKAGCLGLRSDEEVADLAPSKILASALALDCRESDGTVILCNALQTWTAVPDLERATGKGAIASSQALIASCLRGSGRPAADRPSWA